MTHAVSRRDVTTEALLQSEVSTCEICGRPYDTGLGFSPSISVLPCQYYSTSLPHFHINSFIVEATNINS